MSEDNRVTLTAILWFFSALAIGAVFISAGVMSELTAGHLAIALVILALDAVATPTILRWKEGGETGQEKAKQHRIDTFLGDMSDEELIELKKRLSVGDNDGHVAALGDDGELIRRR